MKLFRNIVAVVVGYAIFVISAVLLFQLSGIDPYADPSIMLMIGVIAYGVAFSFIGGLSAQLISGSGKLTISYTLGAIIAGFATFCCRSCLSKAI